MKNNNMRIEVLGSGCPTCKKVFELTKKALAELNLDIPVEYITDIQKIVEMGVMQSPVLAINNQPVMMGSIDDIEEIKKIIMESEHSPVAQEGKSNCGCNGQCQ